MTVDPKYLKDPSDKKNIYLKTLTDEKPLTVDEERLRTIIRSEMERFLFDQVCEKEQEKRDDELRAGLDDFAKSLQDIDEETMPEASARRRKKWAKQREKHRKEIERKQKQRHKCKQQRITKENNTYKRWKELIEG